ncbi:MAG: hypothetical protein A2428_03875 [Bdellovibrionales bacterium RIFOXYC1_FULL_54_43]|nr:MAG: hypothetical protein A2428_03875 [Bdellovibrionales bacterium RIFOXYC1_FULL_54_43]OFZ83727.1 MAG: hypothetical protein A2603_00190 [Bdellovibrionales bacterium RIFOXYD1_FULL_55_31]
MKKLLILWAVIFSWSAQATPEWIPSWCTVESWCLQKATECSVTHVTNPRGFYQGHSQYSILRKAVVLCREDYHSVVRRVITGPVETVPFSGALEDSESFARANALRLCRAYREDWVGAAPSCE